jgi:hypothetical protein
MPEILDTSIELSDYRQVTTLDGRDYTLRFLFNQREGKWYMSLSDESDDSIVHGVKIVPLISLLRKVTDARRPPGVLMARDTTAADIDFGAGEKVADLDPGLNDLGARVLLFYFPEDEPLEAAA